MSYNLFLDDIRQPQEVGNYYNPVEFRTLFRLKEWVIVRTYEEFTDYIEKNGLPDIVSFDHDLAQIKYENGKESFGYYETTGYDCAKYLKVQMMLQNKTDIQILVHSMNPVGRDNILSIFNKM